MEALAGIGEYVEALRSEGLIEKRGGVYGIARLVAYQGDDALSEDQRARWERQLLQRFAVDACYGCDEALEWDDRTRALYQSIALRSSCGPGRSGPATRRPLA